jgi:hypothetical protein
MVARRRSISLTNADTFGSQPCIEVIMSFTRLELGGPVATLWLDHPQGNRINFDMRVELREAMQHVALSPSAGFFGQGRRRGLLPRRGRARLAGHAFE